MTDVSNLQAMKAHLVNVQAQLEELMKEAQEKSSELFSSEAKALFDAYPMVKSVAWTQYTPFFNDGEECTFSAHCPTRGGSWGDLFFNADEDEPYESGEEWRTKAQEELGRPVENPKYDPAESRKPYRDRDIDKCYETIWETYPNPDLDPAYAAAEKAFIGFFQQFDEDMYKQMFGDHARCTLTREGVEVDDVDHD